MQPFEERLSEAGDERNSGTISPNPPARSAPPPSGSSVVEQVAYLLEQRLAPLEDVVRKTEIAVKMMRRELRDHTPVAAHAVAGQSGRRRSVASVAMTASAVDGARSELVQRALGGGSAPAATAGGARQRRGSGVLVDEGGRRCSAHGAFAGLMGPSAPVSAAPSAAGPSGASPANRRCSWGTTTTDPVSGSGGGGSGGSGGGGGGGGGGSGSGSTSDSFTRRPSNAFSWGSFFGSKPRRSFCDTGGGALSPSSPGGGSSSPQNNSPSSILKPPVRADPLSESTWAQSASSPSALPPPSQVASGGRASGDYEDHTCDSSAATGAAALGVAGEEEEAGAACGPNGPNIARLARSHSEALELEEELLDAETDMIMAR